MARNVAATDGGISWTGGPILYNQTAASIFFWFNVPSVGVSINWFLLDQQGAFNKRVDIFIDGISAPAHKITVGWRTPTANATFSSTTSWDDGLWHRALVVRRNSSPYTQLYVDGVSDGSQTTDPTTDATAASTGQKWGQNASASTQGLTGSLARCGFIAGVALTPQEADNLLYRGRCGRKLDQWLEMAGMSTERDWSGNGLDGTVSGTTVVSGPGVGAPFG